ncbi:hypothetical protein [Mesotoga sp.]|uniref:hypothetical protein n=1 Tax=Mesotoga sp. TaxID=2053577 RepID=UPI00345E0C43
MSALTTSEGRPSINRSTGFSFVEVLIALLIIIISVVTLMNFLMTALRVEDSASAISEDLLVKSGKLEEGEGNSKQATVTIGDIDIPGVIHEIGYGRTKQLIEFKRSGQ